MIDEEILKIAKKANLKILANDKVLDIKHRFHLGDKSTLGVIFFLLGGLFLIIAPLVKTSDTASKIIGMVVGASLLALSILTLIRQVTDGLRIKDNILTFQYNLKQTIIPVSSDKKIKMKTEIVKIRRVRTIGSDFIHITHYLHVLNKETPVFKFQMDSVHTDSAKKLGNELTRIINERIQQ